MARRHPAGHGGNGVWSRHNIIYLHNHHLVTKSTLTKEEFVRQTTDHAESRWLTVQVQIDGTLTIL